MTLLAALRIESESRADEQGVTARAYVTVRRHVRVGLRISHNGVEISLHLGSIVGSMFPLGHVTYSLATMGSGSAEQLVGAFIADAAFTQAFGWDDFHDSAKVDAFAQTLDAGQLTDFVSGLHHHVELDDRSHHAWAGGGGYAYVKQTQELRDAVQLACAVDDELARTLAHNFIECAVDLRLAVRHPARIEELQTAVSSFEISEPALVISRWKKVDRSATESKLSAFLDVWLRHDLATINGMVALWTELLVLLKAHTFNVDDDVALNVASAELAIHLAMDIVERDYQDVVTPG